MGLIRKLAIKGYEHELAKFIQLISGLSNEQLARFLVFGTWLRAILQSEGHLHFDKSEEIRFSEELHSFPIVLQNMERTIAFIKKEARGEDGEAKAGVLSIWVHTLRSIIRAELNSQARAMWDHLLKGKPYWDRCLVDLRDEDLKIGMRPNTVAQTEKLSRAILQTLPPIQLYK